MRINKAVKMAPAMAAGVSKTLWAMDNIVALMKGTFPALTADEIVRVVG